MAGDLYCIGENLFHQIFQEYGGSWVRQNFCPAKIFSCTVVPKFEEIRETRLYKGGGGLPVLYITFRNSIFKMIIIWADICHFKKFLILLKVQNR